MSSKEEVQARWTEYFKEIFNRRQPAHPSTDDEECTVEVVIEEIATSEPTLSEVRAAISRLQNGKSQRVDSITLKADIEFATKKVHQLLSKAWRYEQLPKSWNQGIIIKLPKMGNIKDVRTEEA